MRNREQVQSPHAQSSRVPRGLHPSIGMSPRCAPTEEGRGGQKEGGRRRTGSSCPQRRFGASSSDACRPQHGDQRKPLFLQLHFLDILVLSWYQPTLFSQAEPWGHLPQAGRRVCFSRHLEEPSTRQSLFPPKRRLLLLGPLSPHTLDTALSPGRCVSSRLPRQLILTETRRTACGVDGDSQKRSFGLSEVLP